MDFGALARATNFGKMLMRKGCTHAAAVEREALASASSLGETSDELRRLVRNFMSSFWTFFGRATAKQMAEDVRTKVSFSFVFFPPLLFLGLLMQLTCSSSTEKDW